MKTITEAWLAGTTFLEEVEGWEPGDRGPQYQSTPGYRCACGNIYRVGQKVAAVQGSLNGKYHFWAECNNCEKAMF